MGSVCESPLATLDANSRYPRTVEHGLGIVYGRSGPISLSAAFSSLVSSMGMTDFAGRDDGEMRSDGVHGLLREPSERTQRHPKPKLYQSHNQR